jgi:hypothetical protein
LILAETLYHSDLTNSSQECIMSRIIRVDRVVAHLEAWVDHVFPFVKFKIKVFERAPNDIIAVPNVAIRHLITREPEWISGLGKSVEEAVDDLLHRFILEVREHTPNSGLTDADFEWSSPEDF